MVDKASKARAKARYSWASKSRAEQYWDGGLFGEKLKSRSDPTSSRNDPLPLCFPRSLYRAGYNADDVRELFRLIDWMMHLREDLEQRFRVELTEFEEQMKMPYVTSVERLAKAEGRIEGRTEGRTEGGAGVLVRQLRRVLGPLPEEIEGRIRSLSYPEIEALGEELLAFRTPEDLRTWLDARPAESAVD